MTCGTLVKVIGLKRVIEPGRHFGHNFVPRAMAGLMSVKFPPGPVEVLR